MAYKVVMTEDAEKDFDNFLYYLVYIKRNPQAASHLIDCVEETKFRLAEVAGSLKLCENEKLKSFGYHRINFKEMDYFFLYRVEGDMAIIDNMFHYLQDYENKMK
ncbi:type II toxin-antitoxin system RelE/ParE family toxin [Butyrivibrio sp. AC2005]|uniref:type II toxin-antitoxin system RelE/ParE family toxin n=1 Tax=Butyrivibrio sp. AC2005 TaxID=1280672 RepID=UPI00040A6F50|nr:type II toxin-antitoxin system RelE/ParE family toxin [Butyrivibrio sp. AC2005]